MTVYVNTLCNFRPFINYQYENGDPDPRTHVTERLSRFDMPTLKVIHEPDLKLGQRFPDLPTQDWGRDLCAMAERMLPHVQTIVGPSVFYKNDEGQWAETTSALMTARQPVPGVTFVPRMTMLAISYKMGEAAAVRRLMEYLWEVFEIDVLKIFGKEYLDSISESLKDGQALILAEGYTDERLRRRDAFVAFAMNNLQGNMGGGHAPLHEQVFNDFFDGLLGQYMHMHRNPYA